MHVRDVMMAAAGAGLAVVTGANRGIGLQLCKDLAAAGKGVVLAGRDAVGVDDAAQSIRLAHPKVHVDALSLDLGDRSSIANAVAEIARKYDQKVTLLVNNGGVYEDGWTEDTFKHVVGINYAGTNVLTLALVPHLANGARIINVSSGYAQRSFLSPEYRRLIESAQNLDDLDAIKYIATDQHMDAINPQRAVVQGPSVPCYKVSKAMLNRATELLAHDKRLTERGITINACNPGWTRTRLGGERAVRSVEEASASLMWLCTLSGDVPTGQYLFDGHSQPL
eukprot:jgi/Chlat1/8137/Chrsp75S07565